MASPRVLPTSFGHRADGGAQREVQAHGPVLAHPVTGRRVGADHQTLGDRLAVLALLGLRGQPVLDQASLRLVLGEVGQGRRRGEGAWSGHDPPAAQAEHRGDREHDGQADQPSPASLLGQIAQRDVLGCLGDRGQPGVAGVLAGLPLAALAQGPQPTQLRQGLGVVGRPVPGGGAAHHLGVVPALLRGVLRHGQRGDVGAGVQHLVGELGVHPADGGQPVRGVRGALVGVSGHRGQHHVVQLGGQDRHQGGRLRHVLVDVPIGHLHGHLAREGLAAGEHLEQHDPGGVDIAAGVGDAAGDDLRRQIGHSADQGPGLGGPAGDRLGQAEVGHLDPTLVGEDHVLGLDVAVHDARPVCRPEGVEHTFSDGQCLARGQRATLGDHVAQGAPRQQLHRQVEHVAGVAGLVGPLVEHLDHVRVGQPGGGAGLAHEPGDELGVVGQVRMHHLQGDQTIKPTVHRLVHRGHAAAGDPGLHLVAPVEQPPDQGVPNCGVHTRECTFRGRIARCSRAADRLRRVAGQPPASSLAKRARWALTLAT